MNFDPTEILLLTEEDWSGIHAPNKALHQKKGLAIDAAMKRIFGHEGERFAPFDLDFSVNGEEYLHDIKSSSTMNSITISDGEFANSFTEKYENGKDTLYWIFEQLPARDEYRFVGIVSFDALYLSNLIRPSQFGSGYFFSPRAASKYFLT